MFFSNSIVYVLVGSITIYFFLTKYIRLLLLLLLMSHVLVVIDFGLFIKGKDITSSVVLT